MNLSALLGRVELLAATANKLDKSQTRQTDRDCQNSQRETSPSYTPWLPHSLTSPGSQMVISVIISCYHLETGAADI